MDSFLILAGVLMVVMLAAVAISGRQRDRRPAAGGDGYHDAGCGYDSDGCGGDGGGGGDG